MSEFIIPVSDEMRYKEYRGSHFVTCAVKREPQEVCDFMHDQTGKQWIISLGSPVQYEVNGYWVWKVVSP